MMNLQQIKWAKDHDWFLEIAYNDTGKPIGVRVIEWVLKPCGEAVKTIKWFNDYYKLRAWAGY